MNRFYKGGVFYSLRLKWYLFTQDCKYSWKCCSENHRGNHGQTGGDTGYKTLRQIVPFKVYIRDFRLVSVFLPYSYCYTLGQRKTEQFWHLQSFIQFEVLLEPQTCCKEPRASVARQIPFDGSKCSSLTAKSDKLTGGLPTQMTGHHSPI